MTEYNDRALYIAVYTRLLTFLNTGMLGSVGYHTGDRLFACIFLSLALLLANNGIHCELLCVLFRLN